MSLAGDWAASPTAGTSADEPARARRKTEDELEGTGEADMELGAVGGERSESPGETTVQVGGGKAGGGSSMAVGFCIVVAGGARVRRRGGGE